MAKKFNGNSKQKLKLVLQLAGQTASDFKLLHSMTSNSAIFPEPSGTYKPPSKKEVTNRELKLRSLNDSIVYFAEHLLLCKLFLHLKPGLNVSTVNGDVKNSDRDLRDLRLLNSWPLCFWYYNPFVTQNLLKTSLFYAFISVISLILKDYQIVLHLYNCWILFALNRFSSCKKFLKMLIMTAWRRKWNSD